MKLIKNIKYLLNCCNINDEIEDESYPEITYLPIEECYKQPDSQIFDTAPNFINRNIYKINELHSD